MPISGYASPATVDGVTIAFTTLAAVAVALRIFTRLRIVHNGGKDDVVVGIALLLSIALAVTTDFEVRYGLGKHTAELSEEDARNSLRALFVSILIYNLALSCTKLSILFQYLRIFPQRGFRMACYVLMGIVCSYTLECFFTGYFTCSPVAAFWDHGIENYHCLNREALWFANAGISMLTDIATTALPLPIIRKLHIPRKQRWALMAVFALGGVTCIISILRLESLYAVEATSDATRNSGQTALWSGLELNVAIICSCLPVLKGLATRYHSSVFSTYHLSHDSSRFTEGHKHSGRSRITHEEQGPGIHGSTSDDHAQHTYIDRGSRGWADIGMHELGASPNSITVVTVLDQASEGGRDEAMNSEFGSARSLVHNKAYVESKGSDM